MDPQVKADKFTIECNLAVFLDLARRSYAAHGRGALVLEEVPLPVADQTAPPGMRAAVGSCEYITCDSPAGWPNEATRHAVEHYDPEHELVLVIITHGTPRTYRAGQRTAITPTA